MFKFTVNLYHLNELTEQAQARAIEATRRIILDDMSVDDFIGCGDPEIDTPEQMYEDEYNAILFDDEPVIDSIECNDDLFYADGTPAAACTYSAGHHERPGETWVTFHGAEYRAS